MLWQLLVIVCVVAYFLKLWKIRRVIAASRQLKNSYISLPLIGHAYIFLGTNEDCMTSIKNISYEALKYSCNLTTLWIGFDLYTVAVNPEDIEFLSKEFLDKPRLIAAFFRKLVGNGSLMAPQSIWRPRRKLIAPTLSQKNLLNFVNIFSKQSMKLVQSLQSVADGEAFSVWPFFTTYTMDTVCETSLGIEMNAQSQTHQPFREAFEEYTVIGSRRMFKPWLYPSAVYKLHPDGKTMKKHSITLNQFVSEVIKNERLKYKERRKSSDLARESNKSILGMLLETSDDISTQELIEEMLVLVLAATDTSAVGASFTAVMMSKYPEVQKKVYDEMRSVIGNTKRPIQPSDLTNLKYLDAVIKETLRLYPPVPFVVRAVDKDVTLPSGITIVKDSNLLFSMWGAHRHPKYWGTDAEEFNPERFMNGNFNPVAFMPFSCGPRNCIGYKYGMMSLKTMLATLVMHFEILPASDFDNGPLRVQFNIMMKHVDNFKIKLKLR